jgi:hypothetical protein
VYDNMVRMCFLKNNFLCFWIVLMCWY